MSISVSINYRHSIFDWIRLCFELWNLSEVRVADYLWKAGSSVIWLFSWSLISFQMVIEKESLVGPCSTITVAQVSCRIQLQMMQVKWSIMVSKCSFRIKSGWSGTNGQSWSQYVPSVSSWGEMGYSQNNGSSSKCSLHTYNLLAKWSKQNNIHCCHKRILMYPILPSLALVLILRLKVSSWGNCSQKWTTLRVVLVACP